MRIRKKPWAEPELNACKFYVKNPEENKGKWSYAFPKEQPVFLEVGCGKGTFISKTAKENPNANFIAVDIKSDMLGVARRTIVKEFGEKEVTNILLVAKNVEQIGEIMDENDHIDGMYINFCNPWPRAKHKKRRLTFPRKLNMYKTFLKSGAEIRFKTDDDELFEDSLKYFEECGFTLKDITRDLHSTSIEGGAMTEHEKMFMDEGKTIKFCIAVTP
ncbi:MAG: tRNA (guanosine(46)-N7)-methyltransferase TrmB [Acutalibacteraceae bacterium]